MLKKLTCIITALATTAMMLAPAPADCVGALSETENVIVTLEEGTENAFSNFCTLRDALSDADGSRKLSLTLSSIGTFYISTTGRALRIKSDTEIDLNGAELVRYDAMTDQNMFQNCDFDDTRDAGGYSLSRNITIKNGTINGNGENAEASVNLMNFGHAENITLENLTLGNVRDGHLVEFTGCRNVTVSGCTFDGFCGTPSGSNEAVQLDICRSSWNGVYMSDATVCSNVTITGCTFNDFPSGVGNHHTLTGGYHNTNITISDNRFLNTVQYSEPGPAVWCYGFDNSTVKDNIIQGYYSEGIKISCGSVDVTGNTINTLNTADSSGIYITHSSSYDHENDPPTTRSEECVSGGEIKENTISGYGKNGISVNSSSVLGTISSNTITGGKGSGMLITRSTVADGVNSNIISGCGYYDENNVGHGIHITSTASVNELSGNNISGCAGYGMVDYSTLVQVAVSGNTLTSNALGDSVIKNPVTVVPPDIPSTGVSLDKTSSELEAGKTLTLKATITPSDSTDKLVWSSGNEDVATVDKNGKVTARSGGKTYIIVMTSSGKTASCELTVTVPSTKIALDSTSTSLIKGQTLALKATLTPADSTDSVEFKSEDPKIASVSSSGKVTAKAAGSTTITAATASGKTASCRITVTVPATKVSLDKTSVTLAKGKTLTLKSAITPSDSTDNLTWTSSDTKVATVSGGKITAKAAGKTTITLKTSSGQTAVCKVTVNVPSTKVKLSKATATIAVGKKLTLKAAMTPSGSTDKLTWLTSDRKVATVSGGRITAVGKGKATITVKTSSGKTASCKVTVTVPSTKVKLSKTTATLKVGKSLTLKATMTPKDSTDKLIWSTSSSKIATVKNGKVTAKKTGTVTITVKTSSGKTAKCKVTVKKK